MAVVLADGRYRVVRRPHPWPRDGHGVPVPPTDGVSTALLGGAAVRQADGSWRIRLDPSVFPVYAGDTVIRSDGARWTVAATGQRFAVPGVPDVDYVAVVASQDPPDPDAGHPVRSALASAAALREAEMWEPAPPDDTPPPPPTFTLIEPWEEPTNPTWPDPVAVEVGVRFRSDRAGLVRAVRLFKGERNTGPHVASLWSADGQRLASGLVQDETPSGWQELALDRPVPVQAGTLYVASYHTTVGWYAVGHNEFAAGRDRPPLHVPVSGSVYVYSAAPAFPRNVSAHNYWVDVVFLPTAR